jgi:hypothetical protein
MIYQPGNKAYYPPPPEDDDDKQVNNKAFIQFDGTDLSGFMTGFEWSEDQPPEDDNNEDILQGNFRFPPDMENEVAFLIEINPEMVRAIIEHLEEQQADLILQWHELFRLQDRLN